MKSKIKEIVLGFGADLCGVAHINRFTEAPKGFHPTDIYPDCKSVIVIGYALPKGLAKVDPSLIYNHFNYKCVDMVDEITLKSAKKIEAEYHKCAIPIPCDSPYEYWDSKNMEGKGLLSMKHAAVLAGLGCLGKSTLLINEKFGNLLTVGVILTDIDLESDELADNICIDGCRLCIDNCPAGALDGNTANQMKCRLNTYGTNERGFSLVNCNKCRTVCPMKYGKVSKSSKA